MANRQEQAAALLRRALLPCLAHNNSGCGERRALGHAPADDCLGGGLKRDALHEIFPAFSGDTGAATGFTLGLARRIIRNNKWLLWVQQDFSALECGDISGAGLFAFGIDPARFVMVKVATPAAALRAGADAVACDAVDAVVIECWDGSKSFDLVASRKLMLIAAKHGAAVFTLRHGALPAPSAAETRWLLRTTAMAAGGDWGNPRFDAELLRNRHGGTGRWIMEWDCDGTFVEAQAADRCGVSTAIVYRPVAARTEGFRHAG